MAAWTTTIDRLVRNFLDALNASVPSMRAARILDDQLIGYDDWGRLCDLLFNLLVIDPIRSSLPAEQHLHFDLPAYETQYESYEDFSLIRVSAASDAATLTAIPDTDLLFRFIAEDTAPETFSILETCRLDSAGKLVTTGFNTTAPDDVYFTCLVPDGDKWRLLDSIEVNLK